MDWLANINDAINGVVWGIPMLVLLVGAGLVLSIMTKFIQFRKFGYAMRNTLGKIFKGHTAGKGEVTPFQAVTTALAATVGTGNISGVIAAVTLGGPGSIFWLWITALIGMCTKFSEVVLAIRFRERNKDGDWVGGPMYYIKNGLGKKWNWLAILFCIFGALAAFGIGNAVQVNNITDAVNSAILAFSPSFGGATVVNWVIGVIIAIIIGITLIGGIKRLGSVTEKLVPFMSVIYILACLIVIIGHIGSIGKVFGSIFQYAFQPQAVIGGAAGAAIKMCITWGVKRGVFSNEAGLGSAPIAHAASSETNPVKQGLYGIFEVFMDTIVICSLTGLTILSAFYSGGVSWEYGVKGGNSIISGAFGTIMGNKLGAIIIAVAISLFALSTILSWALYGSRCCEYIFKTTKCIKPYYVIFIIITLVGCQMGSGLAWDIADTLNGLMAIPNLVALLGLSGIVVKLVKDHFNNKSPEKLK
ncbi:MAG: sodium:alanine symporter family protein [Oscillospiraceae bacterium]|nr:sodium:alanine symporter family protein [Oscillospiraceae bacterium]